jgi:hypothetical protein
MRSAAATRRLFEQDRANSSANPVRIRCKLPEQRAWDRSRGWPVRIDRGSLEGKIAVGARP